MHRHGKLWLASLLFMICFSAAHATVEAAESVHHGKRNGHAVMLADFEQGIPCSEQGDPAGFRRRDSGKGVIVPDGADGSMKGAVFTMGAADIDLFFQGDVRRKYLATLSERYDEHGPNILSFWIKVRPDSQLIAKGEAVGKRSPTLGVWTYHWRPGDMGVGGKDNRSLTTDSNMHGYSDFSFNETAAGKWVKVVLSPSAFRIARNYYHFYAAQGVTDDLAFFPSLRQLQFRIHSKLEREEYLHLDEIKLDYQAPTAHFDREFYRGEVSAKGGDYAIPVVLKNPSGRDRSYRVFISSFLGVERETLNRMFAAADSLVPMRETQHKVHGDGGTGVVELVSDKGEPVLASKREIVVPAGGEWRGKLIHRIKPAMLGERSTVKAGWNEEFNVRRDTLTTSVIVWDPRDQGNNGVNFITAAPHNSDDGTHSGPPGFPLQKRPAEGWRSEDIPLSQVGGYFISVLRLVD